jgi:hypothetical protein
VEQGDDMPRIVERANDSVCIPNEVPMHFEFAQAAEAEKYNSRFPAGMTNKEVSCGNDKGGRCKR